MADCPCIKRQAGTQARHLLHVSSRNHQHCRVSSSLYRDPAGGGGLLHLPQHNWCVLGRPLSSVSANCSQFFGAPSTSTSVSSSPASLLSDPTWAPEEVQDIRPKTHKPNQQQQEDNPRLGSRCTTPNQWDILKMPPCQQARVCEIPLSHTRKRFGTMGRGITRVMWN